MTFITSKAWSILWECSQGTIKIFIQVIVSKSFKCAYPLEIPLLSL